MAVTNIYINAFASILPFLEQATLQELYDFNVPWEAQAAEVVSTKIKTYTCPSSTGLNPMSEPAFAAIPTVTCGIIFGTSNYLMNKGAHNVWCDNPSQLPNTERGIFDLDMASPFRSITDGLSNTLMIGEGAHGEQWLLCEGQGCTTPSAGFTGNERAAQPWVIAQTPSTPSFPLVRTSLFGSTLDPINKNPVTATMMDEARLTDCTPGGVDSVTNFTSEHPGGANFGLGDGSVRFISESIDVITLQRLGSRQGGEPVGAF